jgi:chromosomal replication initiator protein
MAVPQQEPKPEMPDNDALQWDRVCRRLRAEIGEDVYSSWFTSVVFEGVFADCLRLSVPTRFLRNWIQSHYGERVLELCRAEFKEVQKFDLQVRTTLMRARLRPRVRAASKMQDRRRTVRWR